MQESLTPPAPTDPVTEEPAESEPVTVPTPEDKELTVGDLVKVTDETHPLHGQETYQVRELIGNECRLAWIPERGIPVPVRHTAERSQLEPAKAMVIA